MAKLLNAKAFGARLKVARQSVNLSLGSAAERAGISKPHLWAMEKGESSNPGAEALLGLAKALSVSPAWLLVGEMPVMDAKDRARHAYSMRYCDDHAAVMAGKRDWNGFIIGYAAALIESDVQCPIQ